MELHIMLKLIRESGMFNVWFEMQQSPCMSEGSQRASMLYTGHIKRAP